MLRKKLAIAQAAESAINPQVTTCDARWPISRPNRPGITAPTSGANTRIVYSIAGSAPHQVDVVDVDTAAVAEVDDDNRQSDRRLGRRHRQDEHREHLPDQVVQMSREGDEVDVDRKEDQLER